ncbi:MAG: alpha/beta fold hydrolase, partial [Gammaproteobacteria bacterium]
MENELDASIPFIKGRGGVICRGCLGRNLFSGLDLGELPIANELLQSSEGSLDKFPLHLRICADCGLGQVEDVVTPERIFRDYRYLSSMSTTFLQHAADFVNQRVQEGMFSPGDWVLEIASNDGYLLKNFLPYGIMAIGVEPAENVAEISRGLGVHTISEFFSSRLAKELLTKYGHPKLIIANNVMAHVPDLIDFVKGLAILCSEKTKISIENPSLANILIGMQFDTIYHEHYSYLSASAVATISRNNDLHLFKVEELSIHGGSNRYWLCAKSEGAIIDPSFESVVKYERVSGLFEAKEWTQPPFFQLISQHYLLLEKHLLQLSEYFPAKDQPSIKRVQFLLQQYCHALSPENFLLTNPQLLTDTVQNNGLNLLRGLRNFLHDFQTQSSAQWTMPLADGDAFLVGKDLAVTPGKVVYQNELIELIQYTPQTKKVKAIPLLMMPPWINKYYILDLRPENSLVRWLVEQGIVVFMISWRNPDKSHAHWGLSDYLHLGPIAAIEFIQQSMQIPKVSALGFCIGGTLLSILLAYYKAQKIDAIASATFLASLIDFSEPGELGVFIHEQQIQALETRMQQQGYLEGEMMAAAFNALRPGDLIWRVFVQRYLFGQSPLAFDLLFWNMDTTNMPAKMHSEYLRTMYLANDLVKPGKVQINEVPLDVTQIDVPTFFLSTQKDHIAVWQSTYQGFGLLSGPKKFVLGGSGHIAGIVNSPSSNKYGYYTNHEYPHQADDWIKTAKQHAGSWWP